MLNFRLSCGNGWFCKTQLFSSLMDRVAVHGWQAPLVVKSSDEVYGRLLWKSLSSWIFLPSMDGRIHYWDATYTVDR